MDALSGDLNPLSGPSVMSMSWQALTFAHWRYDTAVVQALLPDGLKVEEFDGSAWIGLIPFKMVIRPPGLPSIPWATRFAETNVRTYVVGPDGNRGVWFFSLDAGRFLAVALARATYRIPYFWSRMSIERANDSVTYTSKRVWPKPEARTVMATKVGAVVAPTQLDYFLTARDTLFSRTTEGIRKAHIFHSPWQLRDAELTQLDDTAVVAAGLPSPTGAAHVRFAKDVEVTIGLPSKTLKAERN